MGREDISNLNAAISEVAKNPVFTKGSFDQVVHLIIEQTGAVLGCKRVGAWEYAERSGEKRIRCLDSLDSESSGAELSEKDASSYLNALDKDAVLVIDDVSTDPRCVELMQAYLPGHDIRSMLDAPFQYDGKLAGVLCAEHAGGRRTWTREEQYFTANMAGLLSIALERDKRQKAEKELLTEKERYQQLAYSSPEGIVIVVDGSIEFANPALKKIASKAGHNDLVGKSLQDIFRPAEAQRARQRGKSIVATQSTLPSTEYRLPRQDGPDIYLEVSSIYVKWNGKDAVQSNIRDVTEAVIARKSLERYADQLRILSSSFPGGFTYTDTNLVYLNVNTTFARWCNTRGDIITGKNVEKFLGEELYHRYLPDVDTVLGGESLTFETSFQFPGVPTREVRISHVPDKDAENNVRGFFTLIADLTEYKETERALRHAQKMEAVGQLTGGLAHDFNNLLLVVMGNLELIHADLPDGLDRELNKYLDNAMSAARRGANLTRKLLGFARENPLLPDAVNINQTISKLLSLLNKSLTASVVPRLDLQADLWTVNVNEGDLEDAILNLSLNARDAMEGAGTLTLSTSNVKCDGEDFVLLSVTDEGCGMSEKEQDKIFEPFYSTKSADKGSGLGLSMVYGFVKRSKGRIDVESRVGEGSTFKLYFPRDLTAQEHMTDTEEIHVGMPNGNETILVVDDETDLLNTVSQMLNTLGYRTIMADSGHTALDRLREHPQIDMIFSDVVLGGDMDGYALALQAMKQRPGVKVLLTSGYDNVAGQNLQDSWRNHQLLPKPYRMEELAMSIRGTLDDITL